MSISNSISNFFSPWGQIKDAIRIGLPPTLLEIWRKPFLLFRPTLLSHIFHSHVWEVFGPGCDGWAAPYKTKLMTGYASGVVVEIGAGTGLSLQYARRDQVTRYIAVEPNTNMHAALRANLVKYGFSEEDGSAIVLSCGAEDIDKIALAAGGPHQIDTVVTILTLCSVPNAKSVIPKLCQTLIRPGGQLLVYEHCLSPVLSSRIAQRLWTPAWALCFGGCRMDCDTMRWVEQVKWSEKYVWKQEDEPDWHLFFHGVGRFISSSEVLFCHTRLCSTNGWRGEECHGLKLDCIEYDSRGAQIRQSSVNTCETRTAQEVQRFQCVDLVSGRPKR